MKWLKMSQLKRRKKKMKSFKQHNEAYTDQFTHSSAEDEGQLFNVEDPDSLQKLNGFVGA